MHKSIDFRRKTLESSKRNIIFLDIDGVLQPYNNQFRFEYDMEKAVEFLVKKYNDEIYKNIDIFDLCAAYYDWDEISLGLLKKLIFSCNCYLVIHSGWRETLSLSQIKALFKLYDLDEYVIDVCKRGDKETAIRDYLDENQKTINEYIIFDDMNFTKSFGYHFIKTKDFLNLKNYYQAFNIFKNNYRFNFYKKTLECIKNNEKVLRLNYEVKKISDEEIVFSRLESLKNQLVEFDYAILINELTYCLNRLNPNLLACYIFCEDEEFKSNLDKIVCIKGYYVNCITVNDTVFKKYNFCEKNKKILDVECEKYIDSET